MRLIRIIGAVATIVVVLLFVAQDRGWGTPLISVGQLPNYVQRYSLYGLAYGKHAITYAELILWIMWVPLAWIIVEILKRLTRPRKLTTSSSLV